MGPWRPPPLLVAAVAGLLVTAIVSAIGFEPGTEVPPPATSRASGATATTTTTTSTTAPLALPPTSEAATTTTAGAPTSTTAVSPPMDPSRPRPPAPGVYRYHVVLDDEDEDIRKIEVRTQRAQGEHGDVGLSWEDFDDGRVDELLWRTDDAQLRATAFGIDGEDRCEWKPALVLYRFPLAPGASWANDSRCSASSPDGTTTIHAVTSSRVVRLEAVTVDDHRVEAWTIEHTVTVDVAGTFDDEEFSSRTDERITEHFSPRHGMEVAGRSTSRHVERGPDGDDTYSEEERRELIRLEPARR